jgi:hypothetical protein
MRAGLPQPLPAPTAAPKPFVAERAEAGGAAWGLGLHARARGLLAEDRDAEALFERSLDHLARSGVRASASHR